MKHRFAIALFLILCWRSVVKGQVAANGLAGDLASSANPIRTAETKRILGIIPNYRSSPTLQHYQPLTPREKFAIASEDAWDKGTFALAAVYAAQGQRTNANRPFGQGAAGYAKYFGAASADFIIGDYMAEAIFPTLLRQDPRYFRRGTGSRWSRLRYAVGQSFRTHADSGATQFNYPEVLGNAAAVAISTGYYAGSRTAGDAAGKLGLQIGFDTVANILKEFSPDLQRAFRRRKKAK